MNYDDIPAVKQQTKTGLSCYNVPRAFFEANFAEFKKNYNGKVDNGKATVEAPAYRAFEILYLRKKLNASSNQHTGSSKGFKKGKEKASSGSGNSSDNGGGE